MTDSVKIYDLITKLTRDTNDRRIYWSCEDREDSWRFTANIVNCSLTLTSYRPNGTHFRFSLIDSHSGQSLEIDGGYHEALQGLYEAVQQQTGCTSLNDTIDKIMQY